jgi:hypothetical protein
MVVASTHVWVSPVHVPVVEPPDAEPPVDWWPPLEELDPAVELLVPPLDELVPPLPLFVPAPFPLPAAVPLPDDPPPFESLLLEQPAAPASATTKIKDKLAEVRFIVSTSHLSAA